MQRYPLSARENACLIEWPINDVAVDEDIVCIVESSYASREAIPSLLQAVHKGSAALLEHNHEGRCVVFSKAVCFPAGTIAIDSIEAFVEEALAERRYRVFRYEGSLVAAPKGRKKEIEPVKPREQKSFMTVGAYFRSVEEEPESRATDEQEIAQMVGEALNYLQTEQNQPALDLLERIVELKPTFPGLFYAKAIAEAKIGRLEDAKHSLKSLLLYDPSHQAGKQLLYELS